MTSTQREPVRADQVQNNAGGFVFAVDKWKRLDRFLILGAEGGTYYVGERELTRENAGVIDECLLEDGRRTVARIIQISDSGRAPKNDPAIFALALASAAKDEPTRKAALAAIPMVCRIGTHLFQYVESVKRLRGFGPALTKAIAIWYTHRSVDGLAQDLAKYQSRNGWGHADTIRLSHPKVTHSGARAALAWSSHRPTMENPTRRNKDGGTRGVAAKREDLPAFIAAFEELHSGVSVSKACQLIADHRLPHECVPNELKSYPAIWSALALHMKPHALLRNLNKMTAVGLLAPLSSGLSSVCSKLTDRDQLFRSRLHPMSVLISMRAYATGKGDKGSLVWDPLSDILDALNESFNLTFETIEPTNKRHLLAIDCSHSMTWPENLIAKTSVTSREGAAAMAMATVRTEKSSHTMGFSHTLVPLDISKSRRLDDAVSAIARVQAGGTDCSLPMIYAIENKLEVDCFTVYTDNETHSGQIHPFKALQEYRRRTGIQAKLVVVGMSSTGFSIADPTDAGMLDVVGFDSAAPAVIADFAAEREVLS